MKRVWEKEGGRSFRQAFARGWPSAADPPASGESGGPTSSGNLK